MNNALGFRKGQITKACSSHSSRGLVLHSNKVDLTQGYGNKMVNCEQRRMKELTSCLSSLKPEFLIMQGKILLLNSGVYNSKDFWIQVV